MLFGLVNFLTQTQSIIECPSFAGAILVKVCLKYWSINERGTACKVTHHYQCTKLKINNLEIISIHMYKERCAAFSVVYNLTVNAFIATLYCSFISKREKCDIFADNVIHFLDSMINQVIYPHLETTRYKSHVENLLR